MAAIVDGNPTGLTSYVSLVAQRVKLEGFVVYDYVEQFPAATEELLSWLRNGNIKRKFHVVEGLENAPAALPMLYTGGNTGKLCVEADLNQSLLTCII
jgi:NADPH-dependent curcumin reductase CurA